MSEEEQQKKSFAAGRLAFLIIGVLIGILGLLVIRFATYNPETTHYHANFAVYINGQREQFKDPSYYEEVKICDLGGSTPQSRTHMHDEENGVVHVHDKAVTWGQFFENLGWMIGPDFIRTRSTLYTTDATHQLNIMLNGEDLTGITNLTNQVIDDKDRLLISYGPADSKLLDKEYQTVPDDAGVYDTRNDPSSCGGSGTPTVSDRLHHLF